MCNVTYFVHRHCVSCFIKTFAKFEILQSIVRRIIIINDYQYKQVREKRNL